MCRNHAPVVFKQINVVKHRLTSVQGIILASLLKDTVQTNSMGTILLSVEEPEVYPLR